MDFEILVEISDPLSSKSCFYKTTVPMFVYMSIRRTYTEKYSIVYYETCKNHHIK